MFIYTKCPVCEHEQSVWTWQRDRLNWAKIHSENQEVICKKCGTTTQHHVDDFYAKPSLLAFVIAFGLMVLSAAFFFLHYTFIPSSAWQNQITILVSGHLSIPFVLYVMISKAERDRVGFFNRHRVRTRTAVFSNKKERQKVKVWPRS